jgi:hypothetical protein
MNNRNREQLRAAIANDLVQGQGGHSPTRELLRQYVLARDLHQTGTGHSVGNRTRGAFGKLLGTTCHRGTKRQLTMARCHRGTGRHRSIKCHPSTICRGQRRVEGAEYDQLQPLSYARSFREGRLLPALSSVAWLQARPLYRRSCEVGHRGPYVTEKSTGYSYLLGKTWSH